MERIDNTGFGNIKIIQDPNQFCYGVDAVILADFTASICPNFNTAVDLGTGNGIIPLILSHKNKTAHITGIELQHESLKMALKSCEMNGLQNRVRFIEADVSEMGDQSTFDVVTCNPPYFTKGGAIPGKNSAKYIARHETTAEVKDFIKAAATLLKDKGDFFMVHRPSRLVDIFYHCRNYSLEPKDLRMVVPKPGEAPNIVLIHCVKNGGKELNVMKDLAVYDNNGKYSNEIEHIYERT